MPMIATLAFLWIFALPVAIGITNAVGDADETLSDAQLITLAFVLWCLGPLTMGLSLIFLVGFALTRLIQTLRTGTMEWYRRVKHSRRALVGHSDQFLRAAEQEVESILNEGARR